MVKVIDKMLRRRCSQIIQSRRQCATPPDTVSLAPRIHISNCSIFAWLTIVTDGHTTNRQTNVICVAVGRIYALYTRRGPKITIPILRYVL